MEGSDDAVRETIADAQAMGAKILKLRLPFIAELKDYTLSKCRHDLLAAATLTLVSIPQAIGFALIMDLPSQVVIVSVIIGGFVGALFFSSHHHVFGPTSSISRRRRRLARTQCCHRRTQTRHRPSHGHSSSLPPWECASMRERQGCRSKSIEGSFGVI